MNAAAIESENESTEATTETTESTNETTEDTEETTVIASGDLTDTITWKVIYDYPIKNANNENEIRDIC